MPEYPTNPRYNTRHYDDLAKFLRAEPEGIAAVHSKHLMLESKRRVAERLADHLAADNPQFDRERFLKACGVEPDD